MDSPSFALYSICAAISPASSILSCVFPVFENSTASFHKLMFLTNKSNAVPFPIPQNWEVVATRKSMNEE